MANFLHRINVFVCFRPYLHHYQLHDAGRHQEVHGGWVCQDQSFEFFVSYRDIEMKLDQIEFFRNLVWYVSKSIHKICILFISFHIFEPNVLHHNVVGHVVQVRMNYTKYLNSS